MQVPTGFLLIYFAAVESLKFPYSFIYPLLKVRVTFFQESGKAFKTKLITLQALR